MERIFLGGGSDAQNELFIQTIMFAALKAGEGLSAKRIFEAYLSYYQCSKLADYWQTI